MHVIQTFKGLQRISNVWFFWACIIFQLLATTVAKRGRLIEKYFVHEQYNDSSETFDFDIALLKLNKTVKYGKNVKPICLQFDLPELDNTSNCYATGWGREDPGEFSLKSS